MWYNCGEVKNKTKQSKDCVSWFIRKWWWPGIKGLVAGPLYELIYQRPKYDLIPIFEWVLWKTCLTRKNRIQCFQNWDIKKKFWELHPNLEHATNVSCHWIAALVFSRPFFIEHSSDSVSIICGSKGTGVKGSPVINQKGLFDEGASRDKTVCMLSAAVQNKFLDTLSKLKGFQQERLDDILNLFVQTTVICVGEYYH